MATADPLPQPTHTEPNDIGGIRGRGGRHTRRGGRSRTNNGQSGPNVHEGHPSVAQIQAFSLQRRNTPTASNSSPPITTAPIGQPSEQSSPGPPRPQVTTVDACAPTPGRRQGRGRAGRGRRGGFGGVAETTGGSSNGGNSGTSTGHNRTGAPRANGHTSRLNSGRQFGGTLTSTSTQAESVPAVDSALQADAPEFHSGLPQRARPMKNIQRGKVNASSHSLRERQPRPRRVSVLKSMAPDISTRIHEDILNGVYECAICTSEVGRNIKIWSCRTCWTVFHLSCITKWSINEGSSVTQQRNAEDDLPPPRQWRCPGCNLPKDTLPSSYNCWCEKEIEPPPISGLSPHSCGQTCGRPRLLPKKCPHPCELLCHAGPCPPCLHLGPIQSCFCGKKSFSRRCVDTNYDTGWSCGGVCGDLMPCGEHTCQTPCHEGLCGACQAMIDSRCYCGKVQQPIACFDRGGEQPSRQAIIDDHGSKVIENWIGVFECENLFERSFDCGRHSCEIPCHPQELDPPHCPRSPDIVSHCPCGKTSLTEMSSQRRKSCEDPIPNCEKKCLKKLSCGHLCQQVCHSNACMPCREMVTAGCRCGRVQSRTICYQGEEEPPKCMRPCKAMLNCGRHECGERCCSGERKAAERQAAKRKLRPLGAPRTDDGIEAEHICTRLCGRQLKCGNHTCPELCHKGPCGSCREAIFDEISCHCGSTVLMPPLPCGALPPPCPFQCERAKDCGHPPVAHNCHGNEEKCPKCPFLGEKLCMCGKKNLRNQPCWLTDVRCGEICGKKLRCGSHFCQKQCHRPGYCEDASRPCQQACGKAKKVCSHPCEERCHAPSACREDKPCQNKMFVTCACQHLKQEQKCNASRTSEGNSKKRLNCDDECTRLARNRRLALALNIDPEVHKDDHIPYSNETLRMFRANTKWAQSQEKEFRVFAADEKEKRLRFKPMPQHQRAFIHSLSEDFGFDSESMDPEPHRHVAVFKTPKFVMAPMKTLAECLRIRTVAVSSDPLKKLQPINTAYNGFLLTHPHFGITTEDLWTHCSPILDTATGLAFDISFLPSEEIVIKAQPASSAAIISALSLEATLKALKTALSAITASKRLAQSVQLCAVDSSLKVRRRELDDAASNGGWSQVAAKAAAPRSFAPRQTAVGEKVVYTVLGSRLRDAKKKRQEVEKARQALTVVDDWEEELGNDETTEVENRAGEETMEVENRARVEESDLDKTEEVMTIMPTIQI